MANSAPPAVLWPEPCEAHDHWAVSEVPVHAQRRDAVLVVAEVGEAPPSEQAGVERGESPQVEPLPPGHRADVRQLLVGALVHARSFEAPRRQALDEGFGGLERHDLVAALDESGDLAPASRCTDEHARRGRREDLAQQGFLPWEQRSVEADALVAEAVVRSIRDVVDAVERRV